MNDLDLFAEPSRDGHLSGERFGRRAQKAARKRQRRRRRNGRAALLFASAFLVAVVGGGGLLGYAALNSWVNPPDYSGQGSGAVTVPIKDGDSVSTMAVTLQQHQVVKSTRAFLKIARKEPKAASIQPGFYQMRLRMSSEAALAALLDPKSRSGNQITIPEGLRAVEVYQQLAKKTGIPLRDFQRAAARPAALGLPSYAGGRVEGYLFPARYDLDPNATAAQILKSMIDRYKKEVDEQELAVRARARGLTAGQLIVVASLLQAEGGLPEDYPKIARVIYNRIRVGMPLQLDTTVLYALNRRTLRVYNKDTQVNSPYNTYRIKALPPGAIDSPGLPAIQAAMNPERGNWIYFVTTDPSRKITKFTASDAEFAKFKEELNRYLAANPGN